MVRLTDSTRRPARNYSSRREQWRLVLLILPLGLVLVLMARLRDPQTADRINTFFAAVENGSSIVNTAAAGDAAGPTADASAAASSPRGFLAGVRRDLLGTIQDNTYFRNGEQEAWFNFLETLQRTPEAQLEAAPKLEADYVQLVDQPHFYRGKLVTVDGWLRQVTQQRPAENELGLESYYRVVLQPTDGALWPIFVYCLQRPPNLTVGSEASGSVKVAGLFFKNLSYRWENGLGTAPVIVAKSIEHFGPAAGEPTDAGRPPLTADRWMETEPEGSAENGRLAHQSLPNSGDAFREILDLAGWDAERLAEFDDGSEFSDDERGAALELLWRLQSLDTASLAEWASGGLIPHRVESEPDEFRGKLLRLTGRAVNVRTHRLEPSAAQRLERPAYFECELALAEDAGTAIVLTTRVPRAWLQMKTLDEPARAVALYLKRDSRREKGATVWLAKELAWHPTHVKVPHVSFGKSVLGTLGMDVGLLDHVESRGRLRTADAAERSRYNGQREAFYQMLHAVGEVAPRQLIRFAERNLSSVRDTWKQELESAQDEPRRRLAREAYQRAAEGRYSVAPLFNEPQDQIGRLVVVDGAARRVARVEVGQRPDGSGASDVARRFGFDHYYELEVFTDDSQNYPLVFCVRELPDGFPTGGSIHVPVRVAGFFFKDWLYRTRGSQTSSGALDQGNAATRAQYAPLLIGRAPVMLELDEDGSDLARFVGGGLFVLALIGVWAVAAWFSRGDRQFRERVLAPNYSLQSGQSLNELNLPDANEPNKE